MRRSSTQVCCQVMNNAGIDIIDPSDVALTGAEARDWSQLKDHWAKVRAAITPMMINYGRR